MATLTYKQKRFAEFYEGNGTEAARLAGYQGSSAVLAQVAYENLRIPEIKAAIDNRNLNEMSKQIADRKERQAFWTSVMNDCNADMKDRLRASELLGKSEADFSEKNNGTKDLTLGELLSRTYKMTEEDYENEAI